jgi:hypothetical protein
MESDVHHQQEHFPPHGAERHGVTMALPLLEAMVPARTLLAQGAPVPESCASSRSRWCTAPPAARRSARRSNSGRRPATGNAFDLTPSVLSPLEPFRDYLTIVSNTGRAQRRGVHSAGDRRRSLSL